MLRPALFATLLFSLVPLALIAGGISYHVDFEGLDDSRALKEIKLASHLTSLKKRPPASINALRYRADSDIPSLIKVLHAHGYYEAQVSIQIHEIYHQVYVNVMIQPGPRYSLESFDIHLYCQTPDVANACCKISLNDIDVELNKPARTDGILEAEMKVLQYLSQCGYPLGKIEGRDVVVDGKTKSVRVSLNVKTGEKAEFGATTILGTKRVKPRYIRRRLPWKEEQPYDSSLVDEAQNKLIDSGLFSSVLITHEETLSANGQLPMRIEVNETKHKSVNVGVSYQTVFGPGVTFGWANKKRGWNGQNAELPRGHHPH
jgi:translocation and assembly module TamA